MAISRTTRTHLIYQFIILTLLFLTIGYNELMPDRKFIIFLAFIPMFCYQLLILSCCMELMPVPGWMNLEEPANKKVEKNIRTEPHRSPKTSTHSFEMQKKIDPLEFKDISDHICSSRRREKSVSLGESPKISTLPEKSKSWMNLYDSNKSPSEKSLSREGSLDGIAQLPERKLRNSHMNKSERLNYRQERTTKANSWRSKFTSSDITNIKTGLSEQQTRSPKKQGISPSLHVSAVQQEQSELEKSYSFPFRQKKQTKLSLLKQEAFDVRAETTQNQISVMQQEESDLSKSYSFPFRQKRLETWLEMKETETKESNRSLDMPYWQTVGYNLAVKYEAKRRRKVVSSPTKVEVSSEKPLQCINLQKSLEIQKDFSHNNKQCQKKTVKSTTNCINKLKSGFTNFISKKKEEGFQNTTTNKPLKPSLSFKSKNRVPQINKEPTDQLAPELPQKLNDRPLLFYPKYIPFEKERFESDVKKKIIELSEEQNVGLKCLQSK